MKIDEIKLGQVRPTSPERQKPLGNGTASLAERISEHGLRAYLTAHPITVHQIDSGSYQLVGGVESFRFARQAVGDDQPLPVQVIPHAHRRLARQVKWCELLMHTSVGCGIPTKSDRLKLWLRAAEEAPETMVEVGLPAAASKQELAELLGISPTSLRSMLARMDA